MATININVKAVLLSILAVIIGWSVWKWIYKWFFSVVRLDNAATTPPIEEVSARVRNAMKSYSSIDRGQGPYAAATNKLYIESVNEIKSTLGADYVLFTQNTSAAINRAAAMLRSKYGDVKVLVSPMEHSSNLAPWIKRFTVVEEIGYDRINGTVSVDDLEKKIRSKQYKIVSVSAMSNVTGDTLNLARVYSLTQEAGAILHVDAAQSMPSHYLAEGVPTSYDLMSFSSHKMYSSEYPIGCLAVRNITLPSMDSGGGMVVYATPAVNNNVARIVERSNAHTKTPGTTQFSGVVALAETFKYFKTVSRCEWRTKSLAERLYDGLDKMFGKGTIRIFSKRGSTIVAFSVNDGTHGPIPPLRIAKEMGDAGVELRAGCMCAYRYVLFHLFGGTQDCLDKYLDIAESPSSLMNTPNGVVRASIGWFNTERDVDRMLNALKNAINKLSLSDK